MSRQLPTVVMCVMYQKVRRARVCTQRASGYDAVHVRLLAWWLVLALFIGLAHQAAEVRGLLG
jgi:hypothetical protein